MPNIFVLFLLLFHPQSATDSEKNWEQMRSTAESQHEIVMLLIKRQDFDKIATASQKIFRLRFPGDKEHLLVREGQILADALIHHGQHELAHRVLAQALNSVRSNLSKAHLYKEIAYLCTKEGKDEEAMEHFEKAVELENSVP